MTIGSDTGDTKMTPAGGGVGQDKRLVAVIDIGSIAIRVVVAEIGTDGDFTVLDRAERPVTLGRDVFSTGAVSRASINQSLEILHRFKEMLAGWSITDADTRVIATSALREAVNKDTYLDRVELRTGLAIDIIEGIEANRLTYMAVRHALEDLRKDSGRSNSIIMEVGGGSTEIMLLRRGRMVAAHTASIGTVRMEPQLRRVIDSTEKLQRFLKESIRTTRDRLDSELPLSRIRNFVAVGGDARLVAQRVGERKGEHYWTIEKESFGCFVDQLRDLSIEGIVRRLRIPYSDAEGLVPSLLVYRLMMDETAASVLTVPDVSIRDGVLLSLARGPDPDLQKEFSSQVIASASALGHKYHYDEPHAQHVAQLALLLFDSLVSEHGLDGQSRLLLHAAAILHDIGTHVASTGHHKHGQYLVMNSEIFGLDADDLAIVSNVVRYHRRALPSKAHTSFMSLPRDRRTTVMKLGAILRVADAMDRGHAQRITGFDLEQQQDEVILRCHHTADISVERFGLASKGDMFEQVFGMKVVVL